MLVFGSSFFVVVVLPLRSLFLSNEKQKRSGSRGRGDVEELGGVEGRETIIGTY